MSHLSYGLRAALMDELVKIGEESKKPAGGWKSVGKSIAVGAGGTALGYGAARALEHAFPSLRVPTKTSVSTARILLPLLGGASLVLADRYRRLMDESYAQVSGWKKPE